MLSPHCTLWTGVLLAALALGTALAQGKIESDVKQASSPSETDVAALRARALKIKDYRVDYRAVVECVRALARIDGPEAGDAVADVLAAHVVPVNVFPATQVLAAARDMSPKLGSRLGEVLRQVMNSDGVFWRDKILAAGALAAHGDAKALEFLLKAYREPEDGVLLPVKQVQYEVRKALCTVPDAKATTLLATELQRMNDPIECLHCLGWMLQADNAQAIVLVRRVFPILKDDLDLLLAEILLRVLDRYGERRDLALLQVIGSEKMLAGVGPDRGRLEEAVQRTRARLLGARKNT